MAQRPTGDWDIDPNTTSGTDLANILNRFQDAIDSGNSGSSRPPYLAAGGLWVQEGNPMKLFFWDGSTDTEIFNTQDGIIGGMDEPTDDGDQYARQGDTVGNFSWTKVEHPEPIAGGAADGTQDGIVATWDSTANGGEGQWTPDPTVIVKDSKVGIGTSTPQSPFCLAKTGTTAVWEWDLAPGAVDTLSLSATNGAGTVFAENALLINSNGAVSLNTVGTHINFEGMRFENDAFVYSHNGGANGQVFSGIHCKGSDKSLRLYAGQGEKLIIDTNGRVDIIGSLYVNGTPKIGADDLIRTLQTLRNATKDETTLEGLRDSIGNAIGGLIEEFENQISTMPVPEELVTLPADDEPETGTMDD